MNNTLIKLANVEDVPQGKSIIVHIADGREIALFNIEDKIYALENSCPHMGGPLGEGEIEGCAVTCPWHGWQFDVKTGGCLNMPGEDATSVAIEVRGNEVYMIT